MDTIEKLFSQVERKREDYDAMLKTERRSSSGSGEGPKRALEWIADKLRKAGATTEPLEAGSGSPPVLRAIIGKTREKRTVLVYAHLNAQCRDKEVKLFGNGMFDAKGPLLCLFTALEVYNQLKIPVPVNLRFICEAMMEKDGEAFKALLRKHSGSLFSGVDYVTILDSRPNYFYGIKPLLCWGLRGYCRFEVKIDCASKNLSSGDHGGAIQEAMTNMVQLLSCMTNMKGDILIPGINNDIVPLSPLEEQDYHKATFDIERYKSFTGANVLLHKEDKKRVLMHMTRFPSISIHSIRPQEVRSNSDIPSSVTGTFSIRIVQEQSPSTVQSCVTEYVHRTMNALNNTNKYTVTMTESSPPWEVNPRDNNIQACMKALKRTYKDDPELIREGSTIPILTDLQETSGKEILLLPIGRAKCHMPTVTDSNIFIEGTKTIAAYFHELSSY